MIDALVVCPPGYPVALVAFVCNVEFDAASRLKQLECRIEVMDGLLWHDLHGKPLDLGGQVAMVIGLVPKRDVDEPREVRQLDHQGVSPELRLDGPNTGHGG